MGGRRGVYRVLMGKPEGKRPLGRARRRWEDNIKMDLREVECGVMDWIELPQYRDRGRALVNAVMNLWVTKNAGNFFTGFSRRTLLHGVWSSMVKSDLAVHNPGSYTKKQFLRPLCGLSVIGVV
jgi:hypothetical protein